MKYTVGQNVLLMCWKWGDLDGCITKVTEVEKSYITTESGHRIPVTKRAIKKDSGCIDYVSIGVSIPTRKDFRKAARKKIITHIKELDKHIDYLHNVTLKKIERLIDTDLKGRK